MPRTIASACSSGNSATPFFFICADDGAEVLAVDVLHRDEVRAVDLPDVEDLDDVRVRERRRDARLVEQHLDERAVLVHRRQDALDDDQLLEAGDALLDGEEELRHAARRELAKERVLAEAPRKTVFVRLDLTARARSRNAGLRQTRIGARLRETRIRQTRLRACARCARLRLCGYTGIRTAGDRRRRCDRIGHVMRAVRLVRRT